MSLLRVYENGQPAHMEHFYRWSANGSREGDLVFVVGNPGNTSRLETIAELEYQRDVAFPSAPLSLNSQVAVYELARFGPSAPPPPATPSSTCRTPQKAYTGYQSGLLDARLLDRKRAWERDFRGRG